MELPHQGQHLAIVVLAFFLEQEALAKK